jgi:hypothetical protein
MRYFLTTNASRQYKAGGRVYVFELTQHVGATWRGVLAVADEAAASTLAAAGIPQVQEITEEQYEAQKKTLHPISSSKFSESLHPPVPSLPPPGPVAVVEGSTTGLRRAPESPATPTIKPVELQTRHVEIVDELAMAPTVSKHKAA